MTNEQPTALALVLADELDATHPALWPYGQEAADELRRLYAENEALRAMSFDTKRSIEDETLLRQAADMLTAMPVKHPQQGQERQALLEAIKERLK